MPEILVLDASVAAKWYLNDEDYVDLAEQLLIRLLNNNIEFHAPEILKYELAEALYKAQRPSSQRFRRIDCEESYRHFCELPIIYHNFNKRERQHILEFSNRLDRHVFDSCYVWLARNLGCCWLTDDREYIKNLPPDFLNERILLIENAK